MIPAFAEALIYRMYLLELRDALYDSRFAIRIGKWQKDLDISMKSRHFNPANAITILPFRSSKVSAMSVTYYLSKKEQTHGCYLLT